EAPPVTMAIRSEKSIPTILTHGCWSGADISSMWRRIGASVLAVACVGAVMRIDTSPSALAVRGPNVVINELMFNPQRVYDSRGEWIELYNAGDQTANLAGLTLGDDVRDHLVLPSLDIAPGQYLVLARLQSSFSNGGVAP